MYPLFHILFLIVSSQTTFWTLYYPNNTLCQGNYTGLTIQTNQSCSGFPPGCGFQGSSSFYTICTSGSYPYPPNAIVYTTPCNGTFNITTYAFSPNSCEFVAERFWTISSGNVVIVIYTNEDCTGSIAGYEYPISGSCQNTLNTSSGIVVQNYNMTILTILPPTSSPTSMLSSQYQAYVNRLITVDQIGTITNNFVLNSNGQYSAVCTTGDCGKKRCNANGLIASILPATALAIEAGLIVEGAAITITVGVGAVTIAYLVGYPLEATIINAANNIIQNGINLQLPSNKRALAQDLTFPYYLANATLAIGVFDSNTPLYWLFYNFSNSSFVYYNSTLQMNQTVNPGQWQMNSLTFDFTVNITSNSLQIIPNVGIIISMFLALIMT